MNAIVTTTETVTNETVTEERQSLVLPSLPKFGSHGPLYFDLETVPDYEREELFPLDPLPPDPVQISDDKAPSIEEVLKLSIDKMSSALTGRDQRLNYYSPDWIDDLVSVERAAKNRDGVFTLAGKLRHVPNEYKDAVEARRKKMSVTPEYCRLAAIGYAIGEREPVAGLIRDKQDEEEALEHFWDVAERTVFINTSPMCGYNVKGFDVPVLLVRSIILGVTPSIPNLGGLPAFDQRIVLDLMTARFGRNPSMKMKDLARIYGIPIPAGDVDGSQVEQLMKDDPEKVAYYVKSDVAIAREICHRFVGKFF